MNTCMIDVAPQSIAGITCGRLVVNGKCPVHGATTEPSVLNHKMPKMPIERMMRAFSQEA